MREGAHDSNPDLRCALQRHDRKVSPSIEEAHFERAAITWLSSDECMWLGTRRWTRPTFSWFEARSLVGWPQSEVDFVGRLARESRVRAMFVVPNEIQCEFFPETGLPMRNHNPARRLVLQSPDEAFNHSDTPVFPHRAVPHADCLTLAPAFEGPAPENAALVANEMIRRRVCIVYRPSDKGANSERCRQFQEDGDPHRAARVVVNHDGQPPAKWPALRQRKW